ALAFTALVNRPEPDRIASVADRAAALARLQATPRAAHRVAVMMPDYPGAPGRTGYAVGLDVPASVVALLRDLAAVGYAVENVPSPRRALLPRLDDRGSLRGIPLPPPGDPGHPADENLGSPSLVDPACLPLAAYARLLAPPPAELTAQLHAAWG